MCTGCKSMESAGDIHEHHSGAEKIYTWCQAAKYTLVLQPFGKSNTSEQMARL